ncbi:TonB-dependent siderophore receptor [Herminiimonas arsenitoxidans]|uniref:TonB-dependent siderophore receptor n=1 Tax=Herminiimonas arsenitoxidans TaxID=1809410 RepID=UPI001E30748B|nr:TonB-dependent siderophore receptor [Herminiimonas arsenitoxidans]
MPANENQKSQCNIQLAGRPANLVYQPFMLRPVAHAVAMALCSLALYVALPQQVMAQASSTQNANERQTYNIPAGPLAAALRSLASTANVPLTFTADQTNGKTSNAVRGQFTPQGAFTVLLANSGLQAVQLDNGGYVLRAALTTSGDAVLPAVTVRDSAETATSEVHGYIAKRAATGTKTDTPIIETPQSISVVTSDFIEATGATRLRDALAYTPGINVSPWGSDSRFDWTVIRGFDAQTPGYYLDGLQLRNNNGWAIWQTENYGTERIEVLRGPSSVLYGQTGPGGMINVVSKRPTEEPLRELQVQLGDNSRRQVAGDFSGVLDEQGKVLYRVTGLVRDAKLEASGLPNDRAYIAPSLTWRPSSDTTLTVLSHYLRIRDGSSYGSFPEVGTLLPNPNGKFSPKTYVGEPGFDHFNQNQWMLGYLLEHKLNDTWTVRQNARYGENDVDYQQVYNKSSFVVVNPGVPDDPANFRLLDRFAFGSKEKVKLFTIDNQAQAKVKLGDWQHTFLFGIDYQSSSNYQTTYNNGTASPIDGYSPVYTNDAVAGTPWFNAKTSLKQTGLYVQDQIKWGNWAATLGGRFDSASATVYSYDDGSSTSISDHKFTSRAGLVYLHPSGWAPYFSYSESFSPTVTIDPETNTPLKPETGRQYEVGMRYQPVGSKSKYSAAIFDLRRQNYITYTTSFLPKQTGEILTRGLELEAAFQPISHMNIVAAYTYTPKAIVTASSTPSEIGKQMQAVSRNQFSVWSDYRFTSGIKVGLGARFIGSNYGYQESAAAKLPSYTILDGLVAYDFQRWSLALNMRNLTNKTYISNCSDGSCRYGDLRKVLATATYRW